MKKGIGLASVIVYIIGLCTILSIVAIFNINIMDSSDEFVTISKINEQYTKFNMFFLSTLKNSSNVSINANTVIFDGTKEYEYDSANRQIIYNDGENEFVVCKYVQNATFTASGNVVNVSLNYKIKQTEFAPQTIGYVIGRGY